MTLAWDEARALAPLMLKFSYTKLLLKAQFLYIYEKQFSGMLASG